MKKILLLLPLLFCLVGCGNSADPLVDLSTYAVNGVVEIINSPATTPIAPSGPDDDPSELHEGNAIGTGFFIKPNVIVTNYHVVAGDNRKLQVIGYNDMKLYTATIIATAPKSDLAILKIDQWDEFVDHVHPLILKWGVSADIHQGQAVWALGHPYGMTWSLTDGIVSSLQREDPNGGFFIQTTTSINPGNSGGPLFNSNGDVVGINTEIYGTKGFVGLSIHSDYAKKVVEDLLDGGAVKNGMLGIVMSPSKDHHNIIVGSLMLGSDSIAAGLLPNDVLLAIETPRSNGWVDIHLPQDIQFQNRLLRPGDIVKVVIRRDVSVTKVITFRLSDPKNLKEATP